MCLWQIGGITDESIPGLPRVDSGKNDADVALCRLERERGKLRANAPQLRMLTALKPERRSKNNKHGACECSVRESF